MKKEINWLDSFVSSHNKARDTSDEEKNPAKEASVKRHHRDKIEN